MKFIKLFLMNYLFPFQADRPVVNDLFKDLSDGCNLLSLLEVLSGETLVSIYLCVTKILNIISNVKLIVMIQ